jgi:hypothetical protein
MAARHQGISRERMEELACTPPTAGSPDRSHPAQLSIPAQLLYLSPAAPSQPTCSTRPQLVHPSPAGPSQPSWSIPGDAPPGASVRPADTRPGRSRRRRLGVDEELERVELLVLLHEAVQRAAGRRSRRTPSAGMPANGHLRYVHAGAGMLTVAAAVGTDDFSRCRHGRWRRGRHATRE